jgi:hypothetical protein
MMIFHAMMEFCLDLWRSKFWLIGEWSIKLVYSTLETRRGQDARGDMGGDNRTSKIPTSSETSGDLDLA